MFAKSLKDAHTVQQVQQNEDDETPDFESRQTFDIERQVFPSFSNFLEGLHEQLWRAYQQLPPTSLEYLQRIQDENLLLLTSQSVFKYLGEWQQHEYQARISIVMLNYLYSKSKEMNEQVRQRLPKAKHQNIFVLQNDSQALVSELVSKIHQWGSPRQRVRATLMLVYNLAIHNQLR